MIPASGTASAPVVRFLANAGAGSVPPEDRSRPHLRKRSQLDRRGGGRALAGAEALLNASGVPYEREIASGEPAPALIDMAHRHSCDAIIMGARGRGALRGALLGSVSQRVVQDASMPVTIVKHGRAEFAHTNG